MVEALYEYYAAQKLSPIHADFGDDAELTKYAELRKDVFISADAGARRFRGQARAGVRSRHGRKLAGLRQMGRAAYARRTYNLDAHPYIRKYFAQFALEASLKDLVAASLLKFSAPGKAASAICWVASASALIQAASCPEHSQLWSA